MKFQDFLEDLANDKIIPDFTDLLVTTPNETDNDYFSIGDRWCSVYELLKDSSEARELLRKFAFQNLDPDFSFSDGNLKAQFIPDEDFINNGSAIVRVLSLND